MLGERMQPHGVPEYPHPFWETFYAIERDDCKHMQFVRNDAYATQNGIYRVITQDERVSDALHAADEWVNAQMMVEAGG